MKDTRNALKELILERAPTDGIHHSHSPNVSFYRFNRSRRTRESRFAGPTLVLIGQGEKQMKFEDFSLAHSPKTYFLVSAECVYDLVITAKERAPYLAISIDLSPDLISDVYLESGFNEQTWPNAEVNVRRAFVNTVQPKLLNCVCRLAESCKEPASNLMFSNLFIRELVVHMFVDGAANYFSAIFRSRADTLRLKPVMDHMKNNLSSEINISDLAMLAQMGNSNFSHRFSEILGMSPMKYLKSLRLKESAKLLIINELNVSEIADRVGYQSVSHFVHDFKRLYGRTPSGYRDSFNG